MTKKVSRQLEMTVIVPVYNDSENVVPFATAIDKAIDEYNDSDSEMINATILFIDDGSQDGSWSRIVKTKAVNEDCHSSVTIKGIKLARNFGKEKALAAGLEKATGDIFAVMDSDLQHPPAMLPVMIRALIDNNVDVVDGIKKDRGCEKGVHRFCANTFYATMSLLTGMEMKGASDYKVFTKKALELWREMGDKNLFFRGMSAWIGLKHETVEFNVAERENGESKWPIKDLISLATTAITAYSTVPLKMISIIGFSFVLFSLLLSGQTLVVYASGGAVTGFSTVILILLISSGLIMLSLGVIGEYIARIYEETKGRPRYLISNRI